MKLSIPDMLTFNGGYVDLSRAYGRHSGISVVIREGCGEIVRQPFTFILTTVPVAK